ncbi:cyanophycinase [Azohydromonas caseinilytica]|uniref:Cyanophycinase n=1 Tax=Azohydromonas caseinilytica TaxID=2728836 RepID=A0A848F379_9BURK|nr:cyanophycinase [Azohydromonas caseinilytica]NML13508.1 cyanophycinase [Azohydromonas caseinilytica]
MKRVPRAFTRLLQHRRALLLSLTTLGGSILPAPHARATSPARSGGGLPREEDRLRRPAPDAGADTGAVLMAIGGNEDRREDMAVLRRFVQHCGGAQARIVVLTAASSVPQLLWAGYERAFAALGVQRCVEMALASREEADAPEAAREILAADGVFMTGGDQSRLVSVLGGSAVAQAMRRARAQRGLCIAGTSAGAAALSRQMLAGGRAPLLPEKDVVRLDEGLDLLPGAIVDQHFSERRRWARLMSAVAQHPRLLGVGIDEDTALVVEREAIEVVGSGAVTLLDGRHMGSSFERAQPGQRLTLAGLRVHVLQAGERLSLDPGQASVAAPGLKEAVEVLVQAV